MDPKLFFSFSQEAVLIDGWSEKKHLQRTQHKVFSLKRKRKKLFRVLYLNLIQSVQSQNQIKFWNRSKDAYGFKIRGGAGYLSKMMNTGGHNFVKKISRRYILFVFYCNFNRFSETVLYPRLHLRIGHRKTMRKKLSA